MIRAALPLLLMNVLWGLGIWTAWKLYNHSSTNSEMRKPPAAVDQSGTATALGGGDQPADLGRAWRRQHLQKDKSPRVSGSSL